VEKHLNMLELTTKNGKFGRNIHNTDEENLFYACYICKKWLGVNGLTAHKKTLPDKTKVYVCQNCKKNEEEQ